MQLLPFPPSGSGYVTSLLGDDLHEITTTLAIDHHSDMLQEDDKC